MFATPTCPLAQFDVGIYTLLVSCVQNVPTPQQHQQRHLLPIPAPPQQRQPKTIVKNNRSQKANHSARLRSRSQKRHDFDRERHQSWSDSAHADSHHHWSAAASDNCVTSHDRRPTHSQSKSWSNGSQEEYGPCPNNETCHNDIVRMRHNMLWCTACWGDMSQEQQERYHHEANTTEDTTISH